MQSPIECDHALLGPASEGSHERRPLDSPNATGLTEKGNSHVVSNNRFGHCSGPHWHRVWASAALSPSLLLAEYQRQQTTIRALEQEITAQAGQVRALKANLNLQAEEAQRQRQINQAQGELVAALEQRLRSVEGMLSRLGALKTPQPVFAED
jgi:hypothetical protein